MSRPTIAEWYDDIVKDPSLLQLFPEKEWMSIQELPILGALQFRIIFGEAFNPHSIPCSMGEGQNGTHHQAMAKK